MLAPARHARSPAAPLLLSFRCRSAALPDPNLPRPEPSLPSRKKRLRWRKGRDGTEGPAEEGAKFEGNSGVESMDVCLFLIWAVASLRSRIGKSLEVADGQPFKEFVCLRFCHVWLVKKFRERAASRLSYSELIEALRSSPAVAILPFPNVVRAYNQLGAS